jgi:hypothetical protein
MNILKLKDLARASFSDLKKIQQGEKKIVKTGMPMVDCHIGGLLPGDVMLFSGLSGHGKSELLFQLKDKILSEEINEEADQYVFFDNSLEMKIFNIILRGLHSRTDKKKSEILFNEFNDDDKVIAKKYFESLQDERQFVNQTPSTALEFYEGSRKFLQEHKDKKAVFITIDHILLLSGTDKQKVIEQTVEYINQLKLEFENVYFIILSQLNRNLLTRVEEKNNRSAPNATDLFGSSFMDQIASYNIILFNAYKVGIEQYMKVNPERYDYLSDHFGEEDSKGRVSFNTTGKIFYHVEKTRESDDPYKDIFIVDMNLRKDIQEKLKEPEVVGKVPEFSKTKKPLDPIFDDPFSEVKPITDMSVAFDAPEKKEDFGDDPPF